MQFENLADLRSDTVRRWVETSPSPTPKSGKSSLNNNTIDFAQTFWSGPKDDMPMLLHQPPGHMLLPHEPDQPLDFTMSKFKTKASVASQLNFAQQHMMLLQNNGLYFNRSNNNKSFTRGSSPASSSSEEEGVGPPAGSPRSPPPSPLRMRSDGKCCTPPRHVLGTPAPLCALPAAEQVEIVVAKALRHVTSINSIQGVRIIQIPSQIHILFGETRAYILPRSDSRCCCVGGRRCIVIHSAD